MAGDEHDTHDAPTGADRGLDAALAAGFGPGLSVVDPRDAISALAELESRLGSETRVFLRRESDEASGEDGDGAGALPGADGRARYRMLNEIDRGGMGVIWRSRDNDLGRDVAMKVLQSRHAGNAAMVRRFVEEAQIAGQLQHPGILQVYELGLQPDRRPYFTMKLIKGKTLAELLEQRGSPGSEHRRYLSIFERICQTMAYAHARGVIHRDLKPANVMVGNFGEVQIVDWGLAKLIGPQRDEHADRPRTSGRDTVIHIPGTDPGSTGSQSIAGSVMGTPAYMPPEQARGEVERLDERSDVFALGAILCEMLTGSPPYTGQAAEILQDAKDGHLQHAMRRLDDCSADADLVALARACLAARRDERPRNAKAVADAVAAHLASIEERARAAELAAVEARARAAQERGLRRRTVALALTVVLAVIVVGGSLYHQRMDKIKQQLVASEEANRQLNDAMQLLVEAKETPVSDAKPWIAVRAAGAQIAAMYGSVELDRETHERASAFLDELGQADRDRRMVEKIEDLVIVGATHDDAESWINMEAQVRAAFLDYGIDLTSMPRESIADLIRHSDLAPQLADALELWVATCGSLSGFGVGGYTREATAEWTQVLYDADPDPYRTAIRRQVYSGVPDLEALRPLVQAPEFETALPRTLAWLGSCLMHAGDIDLMEDVFRRALMLYPTDFMLNFDYAYHLQLAGMAQEAIRYYHRALAIRPKNGGMWRRLGLSLREVGDLDGSLDALQQSIHYQPDYAPTYVDLGQSLMEAGDLDGAIDACRTAIGLKADLAIAHCRLGLALQAQGRPADALAELQLGHQLGSSSPVWGYPSAEWIRKCRENIETIPGAPPRNAGDDRTSDATNERE